MPKKYFKCYFCKTGNSYEVPKEQEGKECRCCLAYNYFFNNNYNNNKKQNYNNNYNSKNNNYNNKYHKNRKNHHNNRNSIHRIPESTNRELNLRINNNISFNQPNNFITVENVSNHIFDFRFFEDSFNPLNTLTIKNDSKNYSFLQKNKLTKEKISKNNSINDCAICLEKIKINDDICELKCGHIFHYNCAKNLVDHHLSKCPYCRCDIKTGKKQSTNINNFHTDFLVENLFLSDSEDYEPLNDSFDYDMFL